MSIPEVRASQGNLTIEELSRQYPEIESVRRHSQGALSVFKKLDPRGVLSLEIDTLLDDDKIVTLSSAVIGAGQPIFREITLNPGDNHDQRDPEAKELIEQARVGIQYLDAYLSISDPSESLGKVIDNAQDNEHIAAKLKKIRQTLA